MIRFLLVLCAFALSVTVASGARAQSDDDIVWVQIEAQPSLAGATERARIYEGRVEDVNGFALGGGWYGVAVGPYRRADAELVLRQYVRDRLVPRDSFIQTSDRFQQQFWPVGANVLNRGVIDAPETVETAQLQTPQPADPQAEGTAPSDEAPQAAADQEAPVPEPQTPDETLREARASERALSRDEKKDLQIALKWAGFYNAAIDGAYGRGTRRSMRAWQAENNFDTTGVLTTRQRALLLGQYNAVLDGLGMELVRDNKAGVQIVMPAAQVAFDKYEPPFAQYNASGDIGARVLLISQAGDRDTLFGLYDIMQTLEIVPMDGPRNRSRDAFELTGQNSRIISHTEVSLENGQIKGFTLVWPVGDEERRTRVLGEMQKSFARIGGVLDPAEGAGEDQAIDLVAGLQIRTPKISRSGFFIDRSGTVATASEAVQSCGRLTIDGDTDATIVADDPARGVAFLKPATAVAPLATAKLALTPPRLQSEISVAGYSYEGVLSAATLTFGTLEDVTGLRGEAELNRLALSAQDGDAGGPVFDASGNVMGMLLPPPTGEQRLPKDVSFALESATLAEIARANGLELDAAQNAGVIAPRDLTLAAQGMTVLVSCWE